MDLKRSFKSLAAHGIVLAAFAFTPVYTLADDSWRDQEESECCTNEYPFDCEQNCFDVYRCHTPWSCWQMYYRDWYCSNYCGEWGEWLPEEPPLFRPFMADPRQVTYSVGWRFNDNALHKYICPVSFGDTAALYRWHQLQIGPYCGDLQIDIEGALWAVFDPTTESAPLINADYYVGIPVTYAFNRWQFRLRGYHISSHIGDEYLLGHLDFKRVNPSAEYLDFFISHDLTDEIRLYSGLGFIVHQDESFKNKRFYAATGFEVRLPRFGFYNPSQMLYGQPVFGFYLRTQQNFRRHVDTTYVLGYEFGKLAGLQKRLRAVLEYHDGYSFEGQFSHCATSFLQIRLTYGF